MRTALYYIGIGLILVLFLNSSGPNLDTFIPGNPWEHYCKYELHKHPFHTNEKEYNYFLDTFTSTDKYEQIMWRYMLTQGRFLISYQIFDNIQVNNIGQTHVREILKDTQAFTINYRTEQIRIRNYLRYPGEELISEHLHMINALKEIQNYWNLTSEKVIITDIIPIPQLSIPEFAYII